jgi:hypothetical protein
LLKITRPAAALLLLVLVMGCERTTLEIAASSNRPILSDLQLADLGTQKIFFGHQSVGNDIVAGINDLIHTDRRLKLNIVKSQDPQAISGPAFVEFEIGKNGDPLTKTREFARILEKGMGEQSGIALHKYCYVDFDSSTDVTLLFEKYQKEIAALKAKLPSLKIVHTTVPLTTIEPAPKAWIKSVLGRETARDLNVKRNRFNELIVEAYGRIDPIFDLAEVESTNSDGSRSYFKRGNGKIYTLSPEYTADGGHLNELGRRKVATRLLEVLSQLKR